MTKTLFIFSLLFCLTLASNLTIQCPPNHYYNESNFLFINGLIFFKNNNLKQFYKDCGKCVRC